MTDMQLYIAAGLPTVAVLVGILMNVSLSIIVQLA
jgi:hypothetical protein